MTIVFLSLFSLLVKHFTIISNDMSHILSLFPVTFLFSLFFASLSLYFLIRTFHSFNSLQHLWTLTAPQLSPSSYVTPVNDFFYQLINPYSYSLYSPPTLNLIN